MKILQKIFVPLVVVAVFFPIIAFAAPSVSFGRSNQYTLTASSGGKTLSFENGAFNLSGLDSSAIVKLNVTNSNSIKTGMHITGPNGKDYGPTAEITAGELQNSNINARATGEAGESAILPVKANGANTTSTNPPFLNNNTANDSSSEPDTSTEQSNSDNPSSGNSGDGGGGGGSGSGVTLVPCDGADCTIEMLKTMGANIFNYLAGFGAILAVGAIVMAGFSYIKSGGDPSAMKEAKQKIVLAITGLIILGASVLIVNTVLKVLGSDQTVEDIQAQ